MGSCCPTSYPPCNHVGVQLWSRGGVPIGDDSAAKNLTLWAKSEGGPEGGPKGPPRGGDFWMQSHRLLELHPVTVVGPQRGYRGGGQNTFNRNIPRFWL